MLLCVLCVLCVLGVLCVCVIVSCVCVLCVCTCVCVTDVVVPSCAVRPGPPFLPYRPQVVRIQCFDGVPQCNNSPVGAIFTDGYQVKVNMTLPEPYASSLTIHYTTDGSAPGPTSPIYSVTAPPVLSACNSLVGAQAFDGAGAPAGVPTYSRWLQTSCA